jgi:hypothetical protein
MFKPGPQPSFQKFAGGRDEKENADEVGEETGGEEENPARQDEGTVKKMRGRQTPRRQFIVYRKNDPESLRLGQPGAGHGYGEQDGHGRECADNVTDFYQQPDFDDRDNYKDEEQAQEHQSNPAWSSKCAARCCALVPACRFGGHEEGELFGAGFCDVVNH